MNSNDFKFSKKIKYHILPIGGETNRVDGTKPQFEKTILIDFKKMNRIEEVDTDNFIITAQSGTLLKTIQKAANNKKPVSYTHLTLPTKRIV